ncbi:MAG: carboxypeptidase-like regulatory domain-containing protein [Acidobacteria bacterium]|nr:carboxypeptidase-like regulatory domain-containing protein [Acidobacteriota bacterium]
MRHGLAAIVLILSATSFLPSVVRGAWGKPTELTVRGRVTDTQGQGVPGVPVRVLATRRVVRFLTVESRPAEAEMNATTTGANGFYEMVVSKNREYDFYFLRFYDPVKFDGIRFARPADVEITARIAKRRPVVEDLVLQDSPEWEAVQRLVDLYGSDSTRGRIIRDLGVPDRTERRAGTDGIERETWWYEAVGVAYVIEDGQVVERKTFQSEPESQAIARQ